MIFFPRVKVGDITEFRSQGGTPKPSATMLNGVGSVVVTLEITSSTASHLDTPNSIITVNMAMSVVVPSMIVTACLNVSTTFLDTFSRPAKINRLQL